LSAFDDEFGLFGEEAVEEEERVPTLGARKISVGEQHGEGDIEPEDERGRSRRRPSESASEAPSDLAPGGFARRRRYEPAHRDPLPAEIAFPRAVALLELLAKRLVAHPDAVVVDLRPDEKGAVLLLEVAPDDLGKVIGRGGRVAQALRALVRAGAEGRVTVDIEGGGCDASGVADDAEADALEHADAQAARDDSGAALELGAPAVAPEDEHGRG